MQQDKEMSDADSCCGVDWTLGGLLLVTGSKSLISDPLKPTLPLISFSLSHKHMHMSDKNMYYYLKYQSPTIIPFMFP